MYLAYLVAAAALIWLVLQLLSDRARRDRDAFARSVPGVARVLKTSNPTTSRSYNAIVMDVLIEVRRSGVEPYELSTMWSVDPGAVAKMQPNQTFAIKVDPLNRENIYSAETWARHLGVMKHPIGSTDN